MRSIPGSRNERRSASTSIVLCILKLLREGRPFSQFGTHPVDDVDSDDEDERDAEQDGASVREVLLPANVGEEGCGRDGKDTSKEVTRPAVAACRGGGVRSVGGDHVVDCGHVDGVVGNADNSSEDRGANPVEGWAGASPCKTDKTDWKAGRSVEEEPEAGFILCFFVVGLLFSFFDVAFDSGDEGEPGNEVTDQDWEEGEALGYGSETPLGVDETEGLDEHENQGVRESRQEGQGEDDGLGEEHLKWAHPGQENFFEREPFLERSDLVWAVDVRVLAGFTSLLCDPVHQDGGSGFRDKDQVNDLHSPTKDELNPDAPTPCEVLLNETTNDRPKNRTANG